MAVSGVIMVVAMVRRPVGVSVSTQDEESNNVRGKAQRTDDKDKFWVGDHWRIDKSGNSFEDDRETQCDQEDGVEKSTENLCSQPLCDVSEANCQIKGRRTYTEGVLVVARFLCSLDCPETNC